MNKLASFALFLAVLVAAPFVSSRAQDMERVAAVVNEDVITIRDLEQRVRVALLSSNLPDSQEARARVAPQVLRRLIEEQIQIQESEHVGISIGDGEVANGFASIERQNNMPKGSFEPFLKSNGIDPETLRQQIKAELAWVKVIRSQLVPNLRIGEEEIDARLDRLKANLGKPEYLAAEIFLAVDQPSRDGEVRGLAANLFEQMHGGAPFSALARQFSQSGAASGGDLGWVSEGMLDDELFQALASLRVGQVTQPIRLGDGYHILLLRQKRIAGENEGTEPLLDLAAITILRAPGSSPEEQRQQVERVHSALASARSCERSEVEIRKFPTAQWHRPDKVKPSELPPELRPIAEGLAVGGVSAPQGQGDISRIFMLCSRTEPTAGLPSRDDVKRRIEDEKVALMAQRYLRDLKRAAFVEIRI